MIAIKEMLPKKCLHIYTTDDKHEAFTKADAGADVVIIPKDMEHTVENLFALFGDES